MPRRKLLLPPNPSLPPSLRLSLHLRLPRPRPLKVLTSPPKVRSTFPQNPIPQHAPAHHDFGSIVLTFFSVPRPAATDKPAEQTEGKSDVEMKDSAATPAEPAPQAADAADAEQADQAAADVGDAATDTDKSKSRRKSIGGGGAKGKKLNKKASKPRLLHTDAQPGDHYFVKLKGFPQWPVIICDEDMLPASLLKTRPVTAKRADGTYREDYADGGKNVADRTFPVMYLHTNEL